MIEGRDEYALSLRDEENLTYREIGGRLNVSTDRARQLVARAKYKKDRLGTWPPDLSIRTINVIKNSTDYRGDSLPDAEVLLATDWSKQPNCGPKTFSEILQFAANLADKPYADVLLDYASRHEDLTRSNVAEVRKRVDAVAATVRLTEEEAAAIEQKVRDYRNLITNAARKRRAAMLLKEQAA